MARRQRTRRAAAAFVLLIVVAMVGVQLVLPGRTAAQTATVLKETVVSGPLPVTDPGSGLWAGATPFEATLSAQMMTQPNRSTPFVPSLTVRILGNATWISIRISWADPVPNNRTTLQTQFRDAVAVQFGPAGGNVPFLCMGGPGQRLEIAQWKADWQADMDDGFHDVQDEYPNYWVDYYPEAVGPPPYRLPDSYPNGSRDYVIGWKVGNPISQPVKVTAVEDAMAEGFGTITTQPHQDVIGHGAWDSRGWQVVISRPLTTGDPNDPPITDGTVLAFAVWDGASRDVGGRKSTTSWITLGGTGSHARSPQAVATDRDLELLAMMVVILVSVALLTAAVTKRPPARPRDRRGSTGRNGRSPRRAQQGGRSP